jgi:hypothetical protein
MKAKCWLFTKPVFLLCVLCIVSVVTAQSKASEQQARQILDATNIKGGLIVHISCGDGTCRLTSSMGSGCRMRTTL